MASSASFWLFFDQAFTLVNPTFPLTTLPFCLSRFN